MTTKPESTELQPAVGEHGVWGTQNEAVGGFGEGYDAQVASGEEGDLPPAPADSALRDAVRRSLAHAHVDAADLRVDVEGGQVVLYGSVRHNHEKSQLEARARAVPGVLSVKSQLSILDEVP